METNNIDIEKVKHDLNRFCSKANNESIICSLIGSAIDGIKYLEEQLLVKNNIIDSIKERISRSDPSYLTEDILKTIEGETNE